MSPTTGRVVVNGKDVTGVDVRKRSVAMVYQQFVNYPSLTVFENIASPLARAGPAQRGGRTAGRRGRRLLRLEPYLDRTPLALSGGQQQRTAIARALVKGADLVLLDEPLANLDYKLREELRTELPRIFEVSGAIFVYATTEPSEALLLGGRTICLSEGRALQVGDTPSVYRRPDSLRVAELFSDPPLNTVRHREEGRRRWSMAAAARRPPTASMPGWPTGPTVSASAPTSSPSPTARPAIMSFRRRWR